MNGHTHLPRAVQQDDGSIVVYVQGPLREQPELVLSVVGGTDPGDYEDTDLR